MGKWNEEGGGEGRGVIAGGIGNRKWEVDEGEWVFTHNEPMGDRGLGL